jgi:hypothetical protein
MGPRGKGGSGLAKIAIILAICFSLSLGLCAWSTRSGAYGGIALLGMTGSLAGLLVVLIAAVIRSDDRR